MWNAKNKTNGRARQTKELPKASPQLVAQILEQGLKDLEAGAIPEFPSRAEREAETARRLVDISASVNCSKCGDTGHTTISPIRGKMGSLAWLGIQLPSEEIPWCDCATGRELRAEYENCLRGISARKAEVIFENAGIPPLFQGLTFETVPSTEKKEKAIAAAKMYLDLGYVDPQRITEYDPSLTPNGSRRVKHSLMLIGLPGRGKTGILSVAFQGLVKRGIKGLWIELYQLFHEIQSGYGKVDDGSADEKLRYAGQVPLLFLDDCGDPDRSHRGKVLPETNDKRQILWQIIDVRHGHDRPTLITSNLNRAEFERQWGERLAARVWEMAWVIPVQGMDLRM